MNKKLTTTFLVLLLSGCGQSLPECSSVDVKNTLLKIFKEKVKHKWFLETSFDTITTESKSDSKIQCQTQIIFKLPVVDGDSLNKKILIQYEIQKNETEKGSFSVLAKTNFNEIEELNQKGWIDNQKYLYKKADVQFLTEEWIKENAKKVSLFNPFAALDFVNPKKIKEKLIERGWEYVGTSKNDNSILIFTKDNFQINLKTQTTDDLMLTVAVDLDESEILEN
jgi:hypothetical protein